MWPARSRSRKFSRLFDDRVPNQVNQSLPICVQKPFFPAWRAAQVSSTETYGDVSKPARKTSWGFGCEVLLPIRQQTLQLALGDRHAHRAEECHQPGQRRLSLMGKYCISIEAGGVRGQNGQ